MPLVSTAAPRSANPWYDRGCSFGKWMRGLPDEDRAQVEAWLADEGVSARALADYINERAAGVTFTRQTVWHHRVRGCRCEPV